MSLRSVTRQSTSPAANLLRNSRLFSLPPPLPKPTSAFNSGFSVTKDSDTATLPYPSRQALATTYSGLSRGDWGLKRNLPLKSTANTSSPAIRYTAIDTIEHVTDFESAQDHVRTVEKWEEMDVPMLMDPTRHSQSGSAFERDLDITAENDEATSDDKTRFFNALKEKVKRASTVAEYQPLQYEAASRRGTGSRWKFDGPWIPTMAASEFTKYLEDKVSQRRGEFHAYVVEYVKHKIYTKRKEDQLDKGYEGETEEEIQANAQKLEKEFSTFSEEDIRSQIQELRKKCFENPIESELVQQLVVPFLGLPPIERKETTAATRGIKELRTSARTTHPSAGLGYLRSNAYLTNHPILGPQASHTPVEARLLQPRRLPNTRNTTAKLGVGGIVAENPDSFHSYSQGRTTYTEHLDLGPIGGQKIWTEPVSGSVGADGRILLELQHPDPHAVSVRLGALEEQNPGSEGAKDVDVKSVRKGFSSMDFEKNVPAVLRDALTLESKDGKEKGVGIRFLGI